MAGENVIELIIRLKDEASSSLGRVAAGLESFHRTLGGGQGIISETTRSLLGLAAAYTSLYGIKALAQSFFDTAVAVQGAQRQFTMLLGSADAAADALANLQKVAEKTPFTFEQMREGGLVLARMRLDVEKWAPAVANLAAYLGTDVANAASALGRGLVSGSEGFRELRHAGLIPLIQEMGRLKYGIDDITKLSLPQLQEATYAAFTDPEGKIAGAAAKLAGGWRGMIARLTDDWRDFQLRVMNMGVWDKIASLARGVKDKVTEWSENGQIEEWAREVSNRIQWVIDKVTSLGRWIADHPGTVKLVAGAYIGWKVVLVEVVGLLTNVAELLAGIASMQGVGTVADLLGIGATAGRAAVGAKAAKKLAGGAAAWEAPTAAWLAQRGEAEAAAALMGTSMAAPAASAFWTRFLAWPGLARLATTGGALLGGGLLLDAVMTSAGRAGYGPYKGLAAERDAERAARELEDQKRFSSLQQSDHDAKMLRLAAEEKARTNLFAAIEKVKQAEKEEAEGLTGELIKALDERAKAEAALQTAIDARVAADEKALQVQGAVSETLAKRTTDVEPYATSKTVALQDRLRERVGAGVPAEMATREYAIGLQDLYKEIEDLQGQAIQKTEGLTTKQEEARAKIEETYGALDKVGEEQQALELQWTRGVGTGEFDFAAYDQKVAEIEAKRGELETKLRTQRMELQTLEADTGNRATETIATFNKALDAILVKIADANYDLRNGTQDVIAAVKASWTDYYNTVELDVRALDAATASPTITIIDNATAAINAIMEKLRSLTDTQWLVNIKEQLGGALASQGFTVTVPVVPGYAQGGILTEPTLLYQRGRVVGVAGEAGPEELRPLRGRSRSGGGDVNIYITQPMDRQTIRRVLIPEIKRAQDRA